MDRIIGALTFRREVYAEVEHDEGFTQTAWIIVAVSALLGQVGSTAAIGTENFGSWLIAALVGTVFAVVGFAVGAFIVDWVARTVFSAEVTFQELVRTLGLAYVWNAVGVLGVLAVLGPALACVLAPAQIAAAVAGLAAWLIAAKEALDLEWVQVAVTIVIGWIVAFVISLLAGGLLALLGIGVGALGGLIGS